MCDPLRIVERIRAGLDRLVTQAVGRGGCRHGKGSTGTVLGAAAHRVPAAAERRDADGARLESLVAELVGAKTRIEFEATTRRGRITFTFHSLEALQGVLARLGFDED